MKASMTWSYLYWAPGPFHWEAIYILSFMEGFINTSWISKQKTYFAMLRKKGIMEEKRKCCNMLLCPTTAAFHMCRKTEQWSCKGNMLKDTCFFEGAVCKMHLVSAVLQQPCVNARKVTRSHCSPWTPQRATMWFRTWCWKFDELLRWQNVTMYSEKDNMEYEALLYFIT